MAREPNAREVWILTALLALVIGCVALGFIFDKGWFALALVIGIFLVLLGNVFHDDGHGW